MQDIIKIENLTKSYGKVKAVQDVSFKVKKGELFAFLGVNGAGKSTTISIMCGQLDKDGGKVWISGKDIEKFPYEIKRDIGVVFQNSVTDKALTVKDNLLSRAMLYGIFGEEFDNRLKEICQLLDLNDILLRPIGKLSGGQKRRVDIARALFHKPQILILDEPTTGLDPQTRKSVWDIINGLRKTTDLTVFLTTHYMEEAADADYVVILDCGKVVAEGTPIELKNTYTSDTVTLYGVTEDDVKTLNTPYKKIKDKYVLSLKNTVEATKLIQKFPSVFKDYEVVKGKMDDVFLAVTGKDLKQGEEV